MSFDELTPHLASEITDPMIVCRIDDYVIKKDRYGRDTLLLKVKCRRWGTVYLTYPPAYMRLLAENAKRLGITNVGQLIGRCFAFEKIQITIKGQSYTTPYPRFMITEEVQCDEVRSEG